MSREFERIYVLCDPRTDEIRYVGKTYKTIERRLKEHLHPSSLNRSRTPKSCWIKSLLDLGTKPIIKELEIVAKDWVDKAEMFWIAHFKALGCNLMNATPGGDGRKKGSIITEETKAKLSASHLGKTLPPFTEEHRKNIGLSGKGRKHSEETKKKIAEKSTGKARPFVDQNGIVYLSQHKAAKKLGISRCNIGAVLNRKITHTKGFVFRYLDEDIFSDQNFLYQENR